MQLSIYNDIISLDLLGIIVIDWSERRDPVSAVGGSGFQFPLPSSQMPQKKGDSKMNNDLINIAKVTRDVVRANKWKIVQINRKQN